MSLIRPWLGLFLVSRGGGRYAQARSCLLQSIDLYIIPESNNLRLSHSLDYIIIIIIYIASSLPVGPTTSDHKPNEYLYPRISRYTPLDRSRNLQFSGVCCEHILK